ncbi:tRNA (guanosine(37)-N1)-methyltransferase TrmD [Candidatus Eisenbacteria bacterium]|uniref:tRNA (guanine-N(1)-)-methyltransferase n=1 Tax=Eiseniibacteriota bacterium TaxID=2212470 RepID=A0ABV6YJE7_UNCEI
MSELRSPVTITVLTGFPTLLGSLDTEGMIRVALDKRLATLRIVNLRDYTGDRHRSIDDRPFGGGPGMVLKVEPVVRALEALPPPRGERRVALMSPKGRILRQEFLEECARGTDLVLVCGRYKAVDERVRDYVDEEISLGDYVISGGELAAMVIIDGIVRMIPGVLGDLDSALGDSFSSGILDCGYYTRPEIFREKSTPEVLLSGHHKEIRKWRRKEALLRTLKRRPGLLENAALSEEEKRLLKDHGWSR